MNLVKSIIILVVRRLFVGVNYCEFLNNCLIFSKKPSKMCDFDILPSDKSEVRKNAAASKIAPPKIMFLEGISLRIKNAKIVAISGEAIMSIRE